MHRKLQKHEFIYLFLFPAFLSFKMHFNNDTVHSKSSVNCFPHAVCHFSHANILFFIASYFL